MQRVSDIVGKPIVSGTSGNKLGHVRDLLLDDGHARLVGLVVSNGWLRKEQVLPFLDVQTLGGDAVIARSGSGLIGRKEWREQAAMTARSSTLEGKSIVTATGRRVGSVRDVMVDEQSGSVEALEIAVRDGVLRAGRRLLPVSTEINVGGDVVVIPDAMADAPHPRPAS